MIVSHDPDVHLTYCTNIHPGESWDEVRRNVETHVAAVKARVCPGRPFGVGLRLSAAAAAALGAPATLASFQRLLADQGLYVFTINGFPYGAFHGTAVKERVYRPDWLEDERVAYSDQLATLLAALLPEGVDGSVSTVPGCFRERGSLDDAGPRVARNLARHAATLWQLEARSGRRIGLALEPEPACLVETTAEAVDLFQRHVFGRENVAFFAATTGLAAGAAEEALRRHLGLCLDACHAAVEFEDPAQTIALLEGSGIAVFKIQVSAGLRVLAPDAAARTALEPFAEGVYLHQTVARAGGGLRRWVDLRPALDEAAAADEWRIHFHVPLFREQLGPFQNTQAFLSDLLARQARRPLTRHLEVETYTWDVLPEEHRREPVVDAIARELRWTLEKLERPLP